MPELEAVSSVTNISTVAGRYVLDDQPSHPGVNVFACRLRAISTTDFVIAAPVIGPVGAMVTASFAPFGTLQGRVSRLVADGFAVTLAASDHDALAERIEAFRHKPWSGIAEKRGEERLMPAEPRSVLILEDGTVLPCLVVDYSASGAAISADTDPQIGARVTVGHVAASVVRPFEVGFAVHFDTPQPADEIEFMLEAPEEWRKAVAVLTPVHIDTSEPGDSDEGYGYD
ncbi:PilZ domain-containing protein [Devosia sp. A449]